MKKLTVRLNSEQEEKVLLTFLNSLNYDYEVQHHSPNNISSLENAEEEGEERDSTILPHYATE